MRLLTTVSVTAALAATVTLSRPADACSCFVEPSVYPNQLADSVPDNTLIWILDNQMGCDDLRVTDSQGNEVQGSERSLAPDASVFEPASPLTLGETYTVELCMSNVPVTRDFTVNAPSDNEAPAVPSISLGTRDAGQTECGGHDRVRGQLTSGAELTVLDIDGRATLSLDDPTGEVSDAMLGDQGVSVGYEFCGANNWSFDQSGATTVRVGSFDAAGNFSGWSTVQNVSDELPNDDPMGFDPEPEGSSGGCSASPRVPAGWGWGLALLIPWLLRRRRV